MYIRVTYLISVHVRASYLEEKHLLKSFTCCIVVVGRIYSEFCNSSWYEMINVLLIDNLILKNFSCRCFDWMLQSYVAQSLHPPLF